MATCRQVITSALRKISIVTAGKPAPNDYDATTSLSVLKSLYIEACTEGRFGVLTDVAKSADYEAKEWERVTNIGAADITISLPSTLTDCATGDTRTPFDLALVVVTGTEPAHYLYEVQAADWIWLDSLTLDDYAPLSGRGSEGLACWLAERLADDGFGAEPGPITVQKAAAFKSAITLRSDASAPDTPLVIF